MLNEKKSIPGDIDLEAFKKSFGNKDNVMQLINDMMKVPTGVLGRPIIIEWDKEKFPVPEQKA